MERVQREADGPRRRILEAAKAKGAVRPDAPAAPAAPAAAPAAARRDEPVDRAPALATLPAAVEPVALPASAVASVPAVSRMELAPASVVMIDMPAAKAVILLPPRLLSKVDPELPSRLQRRNTRRLEVLVGMTINADGTVRDVALLDSTDGELEIAVRNAVLQWRYEAQPEARPHTVQLVFAPL